MRLENHLVGAYVRYISPHIIIIIIIIIWPRCKLDCREQTYFRILEWQVRLLISCTAQCMLHLGIKMLETVPDLSSLLLILFFWWKHMPKFRWAQEFVPNLAED